MHCPVEGILGGLGLLFTIEKCHPIRKVVFELVKRSVEWKVTDAWDEENSLL